MSGAWNLKESERTEYRLAWLIAVIMLFPFYYLVLFYEVERKYNSEFFEIVKLDCYIERKEESSGGKTETAFNISIIYPLEASSFLNEKVYITITKSTTAESSDLPFGSFDIQLYIKTASGEEENYVPFLWCQEPKNIYHCTNTVRPIIKVQDTDLIIQRIFYLSPSYLHLQNQKINDDNDDNDYKGGYNIGIIAFPSSQSQKDEYLWYCNASRLDQKDSGSHWEKEIIPDVQKGIRLAYKDNKLKRRVFWRFLIDLLLLPPTVNISLITVPGILSLLLTTLFPPVKQRGNLYIITYILLVSILVFALSVYLLEMLLRNSGVVELLPWFITALSLFISVLYLARGRIGIKKAKQSKEQAKKNKQTNKYEQIGKSKPTDKNEQAEESHKDDDLEKYYKNLKAFP